MSTPSNTRQDNSLNWYRQQINGMLAKPIPQEIKETLCVILEKMLMDNDRYKGFNYNYWTTQGCNEWYEAGQPQTPHEKDKFLYGPSYVDEPTFTSDIQGKFSRYYN